MNRNRIDEADFVIVAKQLGLEPEDVRKVVHSFFDSITSTARSLPFNNKRKIFSKDVFDSYAAIVNIPYIGRLGPVYSRYLKWRANESKLFEQAHRSKCKKRYSQDDIEYIAGEALQGNTPVLPEKKKASEFYDRVWLVGKEGKRQARQVIPKKKDGI